MPKKAASKRDEELNHYWIENIKLIKICLAIWAFASFGCAILLRPMLSSIEVGGTDLGFWFAQQGSILVFIGLIFFYSHRMNQLDHEHGVDQDHDFDKKKSKKKK